MRTYLGAGVINARPLPPPTGPTLTELGLDPPLIAEHRGSGNIHPDHSVYAWEQGRINFADHPEVLLEADVQPLGGTVDDLLVMHDSTLDRTTPRTGPTTGLGLGNVDNLVIDQYDAANTLIPAAQRRTLNFDRWLSRYAHDRCITVDPKEETAAHRALVIRLLRAHQMHDRAVIYTRDTTMAAPFAAAGFRVLDAGWGLEDPVDIIAGGATDLSAGFSATTQDAIDAFTPYHEAGLKLWSASTPRFWWGNAARSGMLYCGYSDDPAWTMGVYPVLGSDDFASRLFKPGHLPYTDESPGNFHDLGGGVWGWGPNSGQSGWVLWGSMSPLARGTEGAWDWKTGIQLTKAASYPMGIEFDVTLKIDGPRYCAVAFANNDVPFTDSVATGDSYGFPVLVFYIDRTGVLVVKKRIDNDASTMYAATADPASDLGVNGTWRLRCELLSATTAKMTNLTTGATTGPLAIDSGLGSGGYVHAGTPGTGLAGQWAFSNRQAITS